MPKEDEIEVTGRVIEVCRGGSFRVEAMIGEQPREILARLSGKMRINPIRVVAGDTVEVALSPYDLEKGRIIYRSK